MKFDKYKLLYIQIDRLTEILNRMTTRPHGRLNSPDHINPISIKAEVTDSFPVMTVVEEAADKGLMTGIKEDILLLDQTPEDIMILS